MPRAAQALGGLSAGFAVARFQGLIDTHAGASKIALPSRVNRRRLRSFAGGAAKTAMTPREGEHRTGGTRRQGRWFGWRPSYDAAALFLKQALWLVVPFLLAIILFCALPSGSLAALTGVDRQTAAASSQDVLLATLVVRNATVARSAGNRARGAFRYRRQRVDRWTLAVFGIDSDS